MTATTATPAPLSRRHLIAQLTTLLPMLTTRPSYAASGQVGKSRPETGIIFLPGSEVSRDSRTGTVRAEILVQSSVNELVPILASFDAPWRLASADFFDVECRNVETGDDVFMAVTPPLPQNVASVVDLPDAVIIDTLTGPTGRFSSYGTPTDIKYKRIGPRATDTNYMELDLSFSTLSQSTQTEIPRRARLVITIPRGTHQAVALVASSSARRWTKGKSTATLWGILDSFCVVPAPASSMTRTKERL